MISNESRIVKSRTISQYDQPRQYQTNIQLRLEASQLPRLRGPGRAHQPAM